MLLATCLVNHMKMRDEGTEAGVAAETIADVSALPNFINEKQTRCHFTVVRKRWYDRTIITNEGYVEVPKSNITRIQEAFRITSDPNKGSVADFGSYKVLYKYYWTT
jgi:hypothetical protein